MCVQLVGELTKKLILLAAKKVHDERRGLGLRPRVGDGMVAGTSRFRCVRRRGRKRRRVLRERNLREIHDAISDPDHANVLDTHACGGLKMLNRARAKQARRAAATTKSRLPSTDRRAEPESCKGNRYLRPQKLTATRRSRFRTYCFAFFAFPGGGVYSGRDGSYFGFGDPICAPTCLRQACSRLRSSSAFFGCATAKSRCS